MFGCDVESINSRLRLGSFEVYLERRNNALLVGTRKDRRGRLAGWQKLEQTSWRIYFSGWRFRNTTPAGWDVSKSRQGNAVHSRRP